MKSTLDFVTVSVLAVTAGIAEQAVFQADLFVWQKLVCHFVIILLLLGTLGAFIYYKRDLRFIIMLTTLTAVMGSFGSFVFLTILLLYSIYLKTGENIKDFLSSLFPESEFSAVEKVYDRISHGLEKFDPESNPLPFMDVIEFGSEKQKRLAIEKILRFFRPEFSPALRKALEDPSNGIRVLAATAVNTLDKNLFEIYLSMLEKLRGGDEKMETLLAFANHCYLYVQSDILDESRSKKVILDAINAYRKILKRDPKNISVIEKLSRIYVKEGLYHEVLELLDPVIKKNETVTGEVIKWYMAALYYLKNYDQLEVFASAHLENAKDVSTSLEVKEMILAWGGIYE